MINTRSSTEFVSRPSSSLTRRVESASHVSLQDNDAVICRTLCATNDSTRPIIGRCGCVRVGEILQLCLLCCTARVPGTLDMRRPHEGCLNSSWVLEFWSCVATLYRILPDGSWLTDIERCSLVYEYRLLQWWYVGQSSAAFAVLIIIYSFDVPAVTQTTTRFEETINRSFNLVPKNVRSYHVNVWSLFVFLVFWSCKRLS